MYEQLESRHAPAAAALVSVAPPSSLFPHHQLPAAALSASALPAAVEFLLHVLQTLHWNAHASAPQEQLHVHETPERALHAAALFLIERRGAIAALLPPDAAGPLPTGPAWAWMGLSGIAVCMVCSIRPNERTLAHNEIKGGVIISEEGIGEAACITALCAKLVPVAFVICHGHRMELVLSGNITGRYFAGMVCKGRS
eukprot:1157118-Pelagomonas_calceolata.AAC.5